MTVIRSHVSRRTDRDPNSALALARRRQAERDQTRAHAAALRVIDLLDAARETAPGPMATPIEEITHGPQEPAPDLRTPVYVSRDLEPAYARQTVASYDRSVLIALALLAASLIGLALGKLL